MMEPVPYRKFSRDPIGCFTADLTPDGWQNTKYDHEPDNKLESAEVGEFIRTVHEFMKLCPDMARLTAFFKKHGTRIAHDGITATYAVNFLGIHLDYTIQTSGYNMQAFPFRKYKGGKAI